MTRLTSETNRFPANDGDAAKNSGVPQTAEISKRPPEASSEAPQECSAPKDSPEQSDPPARTVDLTAPLADAFGFYGPVCLAVGVFYTFCFYKNPASITWPLFSAVFFFVLCKLFIRMGIQVRKDSAFLIGGSLLLSLSMPLTASPTLHGLTRLALFLLLAVFLIRQLCGDLDWTLTNWLAAILKYVGSLLAAVPVPFRHAARFTRSDKTPAARNLVLAAAGICASIPFTAVMVCLLGDADAIFAEFIGRLFRDFLNLNTVFSVCLESLAAAVSLYAVLCTFYTRPIKPGARCERNGNPLLAVSFLGCVVVLYLAFCMIQVYYLFLRQGALPADMTYSEYAHQGFFQLVFVVCVNLALVLSVLRFFRSTGLLRLTLTVISACTLVMTASAAYRMLLYVACYRLTLLRLLVLWFLAMTAVLMVGVFRLIYKEEFPLFRYGLAVVSVFYVVLAFARPDAVIAKYNLTRHNTVTSGDLAYLKRLSADAAPVLEKYLPEFSEETGPWEDREEFLADFCKSALRRQKTGSPRTYNLSVARAQKLLDRLEASETPGTAATRGTAVSGN